MYVMRNYTNGTNYENLLVCLRSIVARECNDHVSLQVYLPSPSQMAAVLRSALTPGLVALYPVDAGLRLDA